MKLVVVAAFIAVCGAAKLDRGYLPPASAKSAGGSPGALQTPFQTGSTYTQGNQGLGGLPKGSHTNEFQGVVVDAASAGTRAAEPGETGLGAPRASYGGFGASRVGDAAFRGAPSAGFRQLPAENDGAEAHASAQFGDSPHPGSDHSAGFNTPSLNAQPVEAERPQAEQDRNAEILRFESEVGSESFRYAFETDNGITAEETGVAKDGVQAQGAYSYTGDDGQTYSVTYTADENGYQPVGDHLPTPPPIPEAILKSLEQNARDEAAGLSDDGSYDAQKYNAGSDYNESDNGNRYNGKQSNIGSRNGADASASGSFVSQNSAPFIQHDAGNTDETMRLEQSVGLAQHFLDDRKPTGFGALANNLNGFSQKYSAKASAAVNNGFGQADNNDFGQRGSGSNSGVGSSAELNNDFSQHSTSRSFGSEQESNNAESSTNNGFSQATPSQDRFTAQSSRNNQLGSIQGNNGFGHTSPSHSNFGNMFGQSNASHGNNNANNPQDSDDNGDGQTAKATSSVSSDNGFGQTFGNNNNFGVKQQSQTGSKAKNFGYLPPKNTPSTPSRRPSFTQQESTSLRPSSTPAFSQQYSESSGQQYSNNGNYQSQSHQTPEASSASSFASAQYNLPAQSSANVGDRFPQKLSNAQNRYQQSSQSSLSRQSKPSSAPANQPINIPSNRFSQEPSANQARNPSPQGFRQQAQNTPHHVTNSDSHSQKSASAFAASNPQAESGPPSYFNNEAEPQFSASTEQPQQHIQFAQFNKQPKPNQFSQNKPKFNQFASSTKRPFSQNTLPSQQQSSKTQDDSYYYNQPPQTFNTPVQPQNSFPNTPSNRFENGQSSLSSHASAQFSAPSQKGSPSRQPGTTRYPRPPTLAPVASTAASHTETDHLQPTFQSRYNGVTQAAASSFASPTPTFQYNGQSQRFSQAPSRPIQQQSFNVQAKGQSHSTFPQRSQPSSFPQPTTASLQSFPPKSQFGRKNQQFHGSQSFGQPPTTNQFQSQTEATEEPSSESTPSQQYSGELYEYTKPAETLPPPDTTPQSSDEKPVQFGAKVEQDNEESTQDSEKPQGSFGARPTPNQYQARKPEQRTYTQFDDQSSQYNAQAQASAGFEAPEQKPQSDAFSGAQFSRAQFSGQPDSQTFKFDDQSSSQTAGKGEVFGGPRAPPSFDEETGYHY